MPTYDYGCAACGHVFEVFEGLHAVGSRSCPNCGRNRARRRLGTGAGVVFKGAGFYTTDYRRGAAPKEEKPAAKA